MSTVSASIDANDLRVRREQAGMSQQRLATEATCSVSMIRLLEGGFAPRRSPTRDRIVAVLAAAAIGGSTLSIEADPPRCCSRCGREVHSDLEALMIEGTVTDGEGNEEIVEGTEAAICFGCLVPGELEYLGLEDRA